MKNKLQPLLLLTLLCGLLTIALFSPAAPASAAKTPPPAGADDVKPTPTPAPSVNQIRLNQCKVKDLPKTSEALVAQERRVGLVMDARPFAINQTFGKLDFNGNAGRVTVLHMNPFVYSYKITVAQKEIVSTALNDFINLLLPPALGKAVGFQSGTADVLNAKTNSVSKVKLIEDRLKTYTPCTTTTDACAAINAMNDAFNEIRTLLPGLESATSPQLGGIPADDAYAKYTTQLAKVRDVEADAYTSCDSATELNKLLGGYGLGAHFTKLKDAQTAISSAVARVNDLKEMVKTYNADADLSGSKPVPRCKGFNCVDQFDKYADAALEVLGGPTTGYQGALNKRVANAEEMRSMLNLTDEMKTKEGLFARTFDVPKKFELSEATVSINRTELRPQKQAAGSGNESGSAGDDAARNPGTSGGSGGGNVTGSVGSIGEALTAPGPQSGSATPTPAPTQTPAARPGGNSLTPAGQVNEVVRIGRPRFALSGGLVYSPLPRRTFQSVKGFAKDAQGNPTGDGSANLVGFGENSSRRLLPMVMLNTRLADFDAASFFFSTGVSAKYDDNVDIEYLFGPSVGLLNNRVLFTAGLYGGKTQNLLADVAVGDVIPDAAGDAKLFRKTMTWKPGFSVSYFFSRPPKQNSGGGSGGTGGAAPPAADVKDEIRIGSIPFNLAVGMIYTSLEQRTYNPVIGFARDRQGNLTSGRTLTRIVGLTSSSDTRLTPAVMLHSRLTNFGRHDFYFTTGLTGKKTDDNFDIEYLMGGSVNLYRRKLFVTFGAFAGKQQTLGGDFYEGAALAKTQGVTTQNRYVWKPAFSFSYDVTRFVPGAAR